MNTRLSLVSPAPRAGITPLPNSFTSPTSSISFPSNPLRTLELSCLSFSNSRPLFSTTSRLFLQNTRGGIPLPEFVRCTEAQKCLSVSPLLATLTHSVSRKSFPCHSYANTRDGDVTAAPVSASVPLRLGELCAESVAFYWSWETAAICLLAGLALRRRAAITLSSAGAKYPTTIPMAPAGSALPEVLS